MNYGTLKTLAQQYLENSETSFVDNLPTIIRACEEDIFRRVQLPDLMQTSTSNCTAGVIFLPMPADFLSVYSIGITVAGEMFMLLSKEHGFIRECFPTCATGVPRYYAIYNDANLILGPTPDQNYDVELNYFYEPPSLTAGDDNNETWLSINAENALLYGTLLHGYIYSKGDQDILKQYTEQYEMAIAALKVLAEGRNRKDVYREPDRRIQA